ncbi:PREDICTED: lymphocyte-specific protein 1-like isoform X4 [Cyprinodon variegatus]|uniref:lymphocyte-specific protein 1-like isoform X4 n=1 Tax=Cyprinodon variegatus TaxID=28743 RepID=UPI000742B33A|nr:PREDICTED: lymphocyte-specific protein 1-like isoform X4 [Cyprinodon variegatus]
MSESIKRRNSSKQLLQNLIRVTAQRSQEDAEEIERERRRKAREKQREEGILCFPEPQQHENITHNTESDEELKPSYFVLEEDEGFSDWSQRLENRNEQDALDNFRTKEVKPTAASVPGDYKHEHDEEEGKGEHGGRETEEASTQRSETIFSSKTPARTSYSSSVFLSQDTRQHLAAGHSADRTSYLAAGTMKTRNLDQCGGPSRLEEEQMRKDEDNEENVKLTLQMERQSSNEKVQEQKELICTVEEKEEIRKEQAHWAAEKEQEEYYALKNKRCEESQRRWSEEMSSGLAGFSDGEEPLNCYGPMSPTFKKLLVQFYPDEVNSRVSPDGKCKITERTESLRRSTSTIKKTLPPISVSKIDKRLEEYTHALEVASKEGRSSCQVLADLTSPSEPVASKKNLFEAGEAWNQNVISVTPCKDADGLKVGVADLINQWVKGGEDGSRSSSPSKPAENSTKRYKYVVTGHGKYAKVPGHGCNEDLNCQLDSSMKSCEAGVVEN